MTSAMRLSDQALCDIQGIITSGYGHLPYAAYLFVSMTNAAGARRWLSAIADSITTSQHRIVGHRLPEDRPPLAVNIGLTAEGLRAIDLPAEVITTFPVEFQDGIASEERSRILGDTGASAPQTWEVGGPLTDPVHAMLTLFAADEAALDDAIRDTRASQQQRRHHADRAGADDEDRDLNASHGLSPPRRRSSRAARRLSPGAPTAPRTRRRSRRSRRRGRACPAW